MTAFPYALSVGFDDSGSSGCAVLGFEHDGMFIYDPSLSDCGRFDAKAEERGLTESQAGQLMRFNAMIREATDAALNAGSKSVQDALGVATGDTAGIFFSGGDAYRAMSKTFADYLLQELITEGVANAAS